MGTRIHVHTKHIIEYGNGRFNYQQESIYNMLTELNVQIFTTDPDCPEYSLNWDMHKEELSAALEKMKSEEFKPEIEGYTKQDIVDYFEDALQKAEPSKEYIHFSWF